MTKSADQYRIDSHKMMHHPERLADWKAGKAIYPLYMEVSPSGTCNHRCVYCALDFMEYQRRFLEVGILKERLTELGRLGLKSIMFAGEGEPFLHSAMTEIAQHTKAQGIDVAFTTNGTLMKKEISEGILKVTEWIKISINGATAATYAKIHRTSENDFQRLIKNLNDAVKIRRENGYACTIGMQLLLLPENHEEAVPLARLAKDMGLDYLVVKPYSQHPQSRTNVYSQIKYSDYLFLQDELAKENTEHFQTIFRLNTMKKWDEEGRRRYARCMALPFWSYIDAGGNVWGCSVYLNNEKFLYGNIYHNTFEQIWLGEKRKESLHWVETQMDAAGCRVNCRMDEVNRYLWELKQPPEHVNFI